MTAPVERLDTLNVANALIAVQNLKQTMLREMQFPCYILQGWTSYLDTVRMDFRVDSIVGRGYNREVLVSRAVADTGTRAWWLVFSRDTSGWVFDTVGHWTRPLKYDTVRYLGNARRMAHWMKQEWGDSGTSYWTMTAPLGNRRHEYFRLRLWKVLGDPSVNYGRNQQCLFRISRTVQLDGTYCDSLINTYSTKYIR